MENIKSNERGAVMIVEASIVFPVMFIIVLIMIMAGNAYLQNSRAAYLVSRAAINNAAACANPMLDYVQENGAVPQRPGQVQVEPYRYIANVLSGMETLEGKVERELQQQIGGLDTGVFNGMSPQNVSVDATYKPGALCATFLIECSFDVVFPIRMIGSNENFKFTYQIQFEQPVNDSTEFVRNRSMAMDYLERSEVASEAIEKIKKAMEKVGEIIN